MSYFNDSDSDDVSVNSSYDSNSDNESDSDNDFIIGGATDKSKNKENLAMLHQDDIPYDDDDEDDEDIGEIENPEDENEEENNNDSDNDEYNENEEDEGKEKISKKNIKHIPSNFKIEDEEEDEDDDDADGEEYLKKFNDEINTNYIMSFHQESVLHNYDEILKMAIVTRNKDGTIIDPLHKTLPYLTKYEKTRVIGQRAKQIDSGATAFVKVPENVIEGYLIAEIELKEKKIPFIIRRPLPNGGSEYWHISDLENIIF